MHDDCFLIYALARTGSTALADAFNCHPAVRCVSEPFNPDNPRVSYRCRMASGLGLQAVLGEIWRDYNGIKHVCSPFGFPFEEGSRANTELLTCGCRVVLMYRRNVLRRLVSECVSYQTGRWRMQDLAPVLGDGAFPFEALDPERLARSLSAEAVFLAESRQALGNAGITYLDVAYEDLFGEIAEAGQVEVLFEFIGRPLREVSPDGMRRIDWLLDPARKVNSERTYGLIPNIEEIEEELGSDEHGWLFR